jgi:DNA adenine methylase
MRLPHPIPYQGSKRSLAPLIARYVPQGIVTWFEPFAGSAAMTIWAAKNNIARRYVISDVLEPIAKLWVTIIERPESAADRYREIWLGQMAADTSYFNSVRDRYNAGRDPIDLLYLICRCVKNAVRFNRNGAFTQSVDKRRLGMHPDKMRIAITSASVLLRHRTEVRCGDWLQTTSDARPKDFVYMDPPYLGTTIGRDKRYAEQLPLTKLVAGLSDLRCRGVRFAISYDGMTGGREYGPPLPESLGLKRLLLHAGRSSQSTLVGRSEDTVESLYLTPGLSEERAPLAPSKRDCLDQAVFAF